MWPNRFSVSDKAVYLTPSSLAGGKVKRGRIAKSNLLLDGV